MLCKQTGLHVLFYLFVSASVTTNAVDVVLVSEPPIAVHDEGYMNGHGLYG